MTEKQLQNAVLEIATVLKWRSYHTFDSRRSQPGFPDLVLIRDERIIYAELKTESGVVSADQQGWLDGLQRVADAVNDPDRGAHPLMMVTVWRPDSLDDEIPRALARGGR